MSKSAHGKAASTSVRANIDELLSDLSPENRALFDERQMVHEVAHLVRTLRRKANMTQAGLAAAIGTQQAHISDIERGVGPNGPTVSVLFRIARACGEKLVVSAGKAAPADVPVVAVAVPTGQKQNPMQIWSRPESTVSPQKRARAYHVQYMRANAQPSPIGIERYKRTTEISNQLAKAANLSKEDYTNLDRIIYGVLNAHRKSKPRSKAGAIQGYRALCVRELEPSESWKGDYVLLVPELAASSE